MSGITTSFGPVYPVSVIAEPLLVHVQLVEAAGFCQAVAIKLLCEPVTVSARVAVKSNPVISTSAAPAAPAASATASITLFIF
jgi:hypothetical protein